ncbi:MAG: hypothetical protein LBJ24_01775 [Treponema sp.]|jgi:hypothetical protein|nr:hypothetical protein [Treponema sp.]
MKETKGSGAAMTDLDIPPPPDSGNPIDDLAWIKRALMVLLEQAGRRLFTVKDLAERLDLGVAALYNSPWRLPNFGNPDVTGPSRWWGRTVAAWYAEPEASRKRRWEDMGSHERRRAMGRDV